VSVCLKPNIRTQKKHETERRWGWEYSNRRLGLSVYLLALTVVIILMSSGCTETTTTNAPLVEAAWRQQVGIEQQIVTAYRADLIAERELAGRLAEIGRLRLRRQVLSDLDDFITVFDEVDQDRLERIISEGPSVNVLVREILAGRMSLDEATLMLQDHAAAVNLTEESRRPVEDQLVARFDIMRQYEKETQRVLADLDQRSKTIGQLVMEMEHSSNLVRSAALGSDQWSGAVWPNVSHVAAGFIPDDELRLAVYEFLDLVEGVPMNQGGE